MGQTASLASLLNALRAAAATAEPPFSPTFVMVRWRLALACAFDSEAPTKPTGSPTITAGSHGSSSASTKAVGAHPTTTTAPLGWRRAAIGVPPADLVVVSLPTASA